MGLSRQDFISFDAEFQATPSAPDEAWEQGVNFGENIPKTMNAGRKLVSLRIRAAVTLDGLFRELGLFTNYIIVLFYFRH